MGLPEGWSQIHGDKGHFFSGALIVQLGHIHKVLLEGVENGVFLFQLFREYDDVGALLQGLHRLAEGVHDPGIVVHRDHVGVVEDAHGQGRNDVGQKLIQPANRPGLAAPEILVGVGGNLPELLHLGGAPDQPLPGVIQLAHNGAVHFCVVGNDDTGIVRQVLRPQDLRLGVEQLYQPVDDPINDICYPGHFLRFLQYVQAFRLGV